MPTDQSERFLVAGHHSWCRAVFEEVKKLPGRWEYCDTQSELSADRIGKLKPRYIFFLHWSHKVPMEILQAAECVCFHMTDVPFGRGGSPLQNLILRGHSETMITCLQMTEQFDAGPVYMKHPLSLKGSAQEIFDRSGGIIAELIEKMVREHPEPAPQIGEPVIFKRRTPQESRLPEDLPDLEKIYDFIRMLDAEGYPRAFLTAGRFRFELRDAELRDGKLFSRVEIHEIEGPK